MSTFGAENLPNIRDVIDQVLIRYSLAGDLYGFVELGGPVLVAVIFVTLLMWFLIAERVLFLGFYFPGMLREAKERWETYLTECRQPHGKWEQSRRRSVVISELNQETMASLKMISTLIALAPLLGLLGTVTGMLEVFDVIALTGSNNARTMAAGIAKATIPTMSGMVTALSGIYLRSLIKSWANRRMVTARNMITLSGSQSEKEW